MQRILYGELWYIDIWLLYYTDEYLASIQKIAKNAKHTPITCVAILYRTLLCKYRIMPALKKEIENYDRYLLIAIEDRNSNAISTEIMNESLISYNTTYVIWENFMKKLLMNFKDLFNYVTIMRWFVIAIYEQKYKHFLCNWYTHTYACIATTRAENVWPMCSEIHLTPIYIVCSHHYIYL